MVLIFDECHRSQFGDTHQTIKDFFPDSQLFGFTGTPIFEENSTQKQAKGEVGSFKTTADLFQRELHKYTITHAIEDRNVLRFHVDYYKPDGEKTKQGQALAKKAVVEAILDKHDAATGNRRFNAVLAAARINDAIEYVDLFRQLQDERQKQDPDFAPLKIACVFSPPAEGNPDVKQIQEDLPQESLEYTIQAGEDADKKKKEIERKKKALEAIIADYNQRYGTNHSINEFDLYYQDVQQRIKDQQYPNHDMPKKGAEKIDITIVVDMLLTGFDSKYLNTLYVDKNLKYHGLIQAFSRTNRVLNATKPYGHILDFRNQQTNVDEAVTLFSGVKADDKAREIWLVDPAPKVIEKLQEAVSHLNEFMQSQGLECEPHEVANLKGDDARAAFINRFKEVQRLQTQLDQYTDLTDEDKQSIEQILPADQHKGFRGAYLETAQQLREQRGKTGGDTSPEVEQLEFEFVLFASALIDYDYIMNLIARFSQQAPGKQQMSREQLIGLIESDAKFMEERDDISEFVRSLQAGQGLDADGIKAGYQRFKDEKNAKELARVASEHGLAIESLQSFVDNILLRMVFDGEQLVDLLGPLDLGWKARTQAELALMNELVPLLKKRASGREISGLSAYEE